MPSRARPRPKSAYVPPSETSRATTKFAVASPLSEQSKPVSSSGPSQHVVSPGHKISPGHILSPGHIHHPPPSTGARKARPLSADMNRVAPSSSSSATATSSSSNSNCNDNNELVLLLFLIGGREVGQVTVFKRPISIWRLDLTKTF